jgi:hypothetical protein
MRLFGGQGARLCYTRYRKSKDKSTGALYNFWLDHVPVASTLFLRPAEAPVTKRWGWDAANWDESQNVPEEELRRVWCNIASPYLRIDNYDIPLVRSLQMAAKETTQVKILRCFTRTVYMS